MNTTEMKQQIEKTGRMSVKIKNQLKSMSDEMNKMEPSQEKLHLSWEIQSVWNIFNDTATNDPESMNE